MKMIACGRVSRLKNLLNTLVDISDSFKSDDAVFRICVGHSGTITVLNGSVSVSAVIHAAQTGNSDGVLRISVNKFDGRLCSWILSVFDGNEIGKMIILPGKDCKKKLLEKNERIQNILSSRLWIIYSNPEADIKDIE